MGVLTLGISRLPLGNPGTKWHLGVGPVAMHKVYYKGKVVASPKSGLWWVLWIQVCLWLVLKSKVFKLCINQLDVWFMQVHVNDSLLVILPSLIPKVQHAPLLPKCCEPRNVPQFLTILLITPQTHIWIYQGAWERVTSCCMDFV